MNYSNLTFHLNIEGLIARINFFGVIHLEFEYFDTKTLL
jgi:hypothetical protein